MARELPQRVHDAVRWETGLVVALVAVISFGVLVSSQFLTASNVFYLEPSIGEVAIMTLPMTLIIVTGEIDLSVASILGLSSALLGDLVSHGWSVPAAMASPSSSPARPQACSTASCHARRASVARRDDRDPDALPRHRGRDPRAFDHRRRFPARYTDIGVTPFPHTGGYLSYSVVIFIVLAIIFGVVLHATPFGRSLFVMGSNVEAARFAGIRVKRTKLILFAVSGLVCALAGILYTFRLSTAVQDNGLGLELNVVTIVLLGGVSIFGGRGTIVGVVLAIGVFAGLQNALFLTDFNQQATGVVTGGTPARERADPQPVVVRPARTHLLQAATPTRRPRVAGEGARGVSGADHVALDLGAESGRAMLGRFDGERMELAEVRRFPTQSIRLPDGLYWNALGLYAELTAALAKVSASGARPAASASTPGASTSGCSTATVPCSAIRCAIATGGARGPARDAGAGTRRTRSTPRLASSSCRSTRSTSCSRFRRAADSSKRRRSCSYPTCSPTG